MPSRIQDATALIDQVDSKVAALLQEYERCLREKEVSAALRIDVKEILEHCRSALDYVARHAADRLQPPGGSPPPKVYFPIAKRTAKATDFASLANKNVPGAAGHADWLALFTKCQAFTKASNGWLCDLADLVNEHKHETLVAQERQESKTLSVGSGGASIQLGEGAGISLGHGASIQIGGLTIEGGQSFGVGSQPRVRGVGTVQETTWVSFRFAGSSIDVLPFLRTCAAGVRQIIDDAGAVGL